MTVRTIMMISFAFCFAVAPLYGQGEFDIYAGGFFPGGWGDDDGAFDDDTELGEQEFKNDGIFGVRGSGFVTDTVALEGHLGWVNHFEFEGTDPISRALMWDLNGVFHFYPQTVESVVPYFTVGAGGVTTFLGDIVAEDFFDEGVFNEGELIRYRVDPGPPTLVAPGVPPGEGRIIQVDDGDTFLSLTAGGGVKAVELWGPVGLRFDVRFRSMPNFYGEALNSLETNGGLIFTWGEQ